MNPSLRWFQSLGWLSLWASGVSGEVTVQVPEAGQQEAVRAALKSQAARQQAESATWKVFHGFRFQDRGPESGITFRQVPVDDGARDYKAVHYDHGTAIAAADVDGDGRPDLFFANQRGGNQLWRNLGGGRFVDITAQAGVAMAGKVSVGASFADIDNDGRPDLLVTTVRQGTVLFHNEGGGRFRDITAEAGVSSGKPMHGSGAVFFDYDRDGKLDLFVCNVGVYTRNEKGRAGEYVGRSDAFQGWQYPERSEASPLLRNRGDGRFENASEATGLVHRAWSGDATFCDLDADGFPELYVLSMSGEDRYYANRQGSRFEDRTAAFFPKTPWGSMGVKFFDQNRDGLMDLIVTDMHSDMTTAQISAGDTNLTVAFEKTKSDAWCAAEWKPEQFRAATRSLFGNAFFQNQGSGQAFAEVSAAVGAETYWPWGVTVADLNADGDEDVFVTAGMGYPLRYVANSLLLNEGGKRFLDAESVLGLEPRRGDPMLREAFTLDTALPEDRRHPRAKGRTGKVRVMGTASSRSSVALDVDGDGDLDLVTNEWNDAPQVLLSDLSERTSLRFLQVRLIGTTSNRDGLGATVRVHCGSRVQTRFHDGKSGYLAQSSLPLYFGLGSETAVDRIEVVWPSGRRQVRSGPIPLNGTQELVEPK
ncbi:MAG: CRTAC1 family protein [Verrucomicrobiota bacterium]